MQIKSQRLNYKSSLKKLPYFLLLLFFNSVSNFAFSQNDVYDLALITGISTDYATEYCPGDEVRFNNVIYNIGNVEACDVEITAYIPSGTSVSSNPLNSVWTINGSVATTTITSCIPPGGVYPNAESGSLSAFLELELNNAPASVINFYAEISRDDGNDIDSTPDNDPNNDVGAVPNSATDGVIWGEMGDEDDHDVSSITILECERSGCTDPCAPNYDSSAETDDGSCAAYSTVCNADICAGDVTVWNTATCGCAVSVTQVLGCTDATASNYNPAANCDNGSCTAPPAPPVGDYDLALITGISSSYGTTYCPGDEVRFNTVIYNTGEVEACNVEITAYIPAGMSVSNNPLNSIWTINGSTATANINSCIPPGGTYPNADTDPLSAFLILEITGSPGSMVNFYAEISMDDGDDIDSTPDNNPNNDAGAVPNTATDNSIYNPADEDDHDVASITICEEEGIYDLALITGISSSYGTTYCPGDEVRFNTVIYNTGEVEACNVEITAYIPAGMSVSNNPLNSIWTINGSTATANINSCIPPGGTYPNASTDPLSAFLILEISGSPGSMVNFYAEISMDDGDDIDSTPDNNPNNDAGAVPNTATDNSIYHSGDEDDHDVASITICEEEGIYDLALITGISSSYGTTYCPGDEVRFNTVIYNTGEVEACNVEITAYIPAGMSVSNNPLNSIWTINGSTATANINSCIPPGGTYPNASTDPLSAFLILEITGSPGSMVNFYAEISMDDGDDIDSTPDNNPNNDAGAVPNTATDNSIYNPADEDDHDVASIIICDEEIYDLALITMLAPGYDSTVTPGDEVGFSITVYNQGEEQACNLQVAATIPPGMSFNSSNPLNSIWTVNGNIATTTINTCIAPGGTASLNIYLLLDTDATATTINFFAEISMDDGNDIDSTTDNDLYNDPGAIANTGTDNTINGEMGDEDDHDVAAITVGTLLNYDLALINGISSSFGAVYCPGDEVRYNSVIYNTGDVTACNVQITAYIPEGMSVSSNPLNSIWTINGSVATTNITSCIPPGGVYPNENSDPLSTFLILELDGAPATEINFYSEISMDDGNDVDSTADSDPNNDPGAVPNSNTDNTIQNQGGDEDDHDVASITIGDDCGGVIFKVQSHNNFVINKKLIENKQLIEMIYPTISDNSVNVKLASSATGKALIQVVDVNGAVVYNENWELNQALTNNVKIDIDFLSKGLYLIYVTKGDEIGSGKFLKE